MARPTSFRLRRSPRQPRARGAGERDLGHRSRRHAARRRASRFAGSPASRSATGLPVAVQGLIGGPDVWEIVRDLRHTPDGACGIETLASRSGFPPRSVRLAADFYAAYPDEIEHDRLDEEEAGRARLLISRRDQLLTK